MLVGVTPIVVFNSRNLHSLRNQDIRVQYTSIYLFPWNTQLRLPVNSLLSFEIKIFYLYTRSDSSQRNVMFLDVSFIEVYKYFGYQEGRSFVKCTGKIISFTRYHTNRIGRFTIMSLFLYLLGWQKFRRVEKLYILRPNVYI